MNLANPIVVTPPPITKRDGSVKTFDPMTFNELDITIIDNPKRKIVMVRINFIPNPLVVWTQNDYDSAGDYTQAQLEARVSELLGNEPGKTLEDLFIKR